MDLDPLIVTLEVAPKMAAQFVLGQDALVSLPGQGEVSGTVRYIARTADEQTRTFRAEIEIDNPDYRYSAGLSAAVRITVGQAEAMKISPALLVLDEAGTVGIRYVDATNTVRFGAVTIVDEAEDGIWITGLDSPLDVLAEGQEYLREGVLVETDQNEQG